ncbi:NAD dependent epimerase/dehydratase [Histoplasma ohiense]|nr:NAD dependent epimerase/dehydratase [Histoplasma ohiense (nom. inval.)]
MKSIWWRVTDLEHRLTSNYSWAAGMYYPMLQKFFDICFTGDFPNKGRQVYLNHVEGVRNLAQKERLLEHKVGESQGSYASSWG